MTNEQYLHREIQKITQRNKRVEADKAWEVSFTRKALLAACTYVVVCSFFIIIGVENPFINALVPVIGFILSTLSLQIIKNWWLKTYSAQNS